MMKRLLVLIATAFAATMSLMAETETIDGYTWTYRINGDTAEIFNDGYVAVSPRSGNLVIPSILGGKPVTSIGDYAFDYCDNLTRVTIPTSVTNIGYYAFESCRNLVDAYVPVSLADMVLDRGAFDGYGITIHYYSGASPTSYTVTLDVNGGKELRCFGCG